MPPPLLVEELNWFSKPVAEIRRRRRLDIMGGGLDGLDNCRRAETDSADQEAGECAQATAGGFMSSFNEDVINGCHQEGAGKYQKANDEENDFHGVLILLPASGLKSLEAYAFASFFLRFDAGGGISYQGRFLKIMPDQLRDVGRKLSRTQLPDALGFFL
jgi:hypothetical protein